jgi:hypothetical protein
VIASDAWSRATLSRMAQDKREPTQRTPKGHEIPIPKRSDVQRSLAEVAKPDKSVKKPKKK